MSARSQIHIENTIGDEKIFLALGDQTFQDTRVIECSVHISMTRWIPLRFWALLLAGDRYQGVLGDAWESRLVEGDDFGGRSFVFLYDCSGLIVGVEGVHEKQWNVGLKCGVLLLSTIAVTSHIMAESSLNTSI